MNQRSKWLTIKLDERERARRALMSAVAAMALGEYAEALLLAAIVVMHLAQMTSVDDAERILRAIREGAVDT